MQMAEVVMAQAKSKLISQVVKKNMVENVIPVIIALKHMVSEKHCLTSRDFMPLPSKGAEGNMLLSCLLVHRYTDLVSIISLRKTLL